MDTYLTTSNQVSTLSLADARHQAPAYTQDAMTKTSGEGSVSYAIQEQPIAMQPNTTTALIQASGGMLASIVFLVIAIHYINRHFLEVMRGRK